MFAQRMLCRFAQDGGAFGARRHPTVFFSVCLQRTRDVPRTSALECSSLATADRSTCGNTDEDLVQNANQKSLFSIDGPGFNSLPLTAGFRAAYKAKFQEWVEVEIGGKWYVCSSYQNWKCIHHIKYDAGTSKWIRDTTKTNEVLQGHSGLAGWANTWSE